MKILGLVYYYYYHLLAFEKHPQLMEHCWGGSDAVSWLPTSTPQAVTVNPSSPRSPCSAPFSVFNTIVYKALGKSSGFARERPVNFPEETRSL